MKKINPIDEPLLKSNLQLFLRSLMSKFPGSFDELLTLIAAPEKPSFVMSSDNQKFITGEVTIKHMASKLLAIEVAESESWSPESGINMIWIKFNDPDQQLNEMLIALKDIVFNDTHRGERYYSSASTVANLVYSRGGEAILTVFSKNKRSIARYMEYSNLNDGFARNILENIGS